MISLDRVSVQETIASLRDLSFVFGLVILGWKGRSWFQPVLEFVKRANHFLKRADKHMDFVESGMKTLLTNHLHHLQEDAKQIREALVRPTQQNE